MNTSEKYQEFLKGFYLMLYGEVLIDKDGQVIPYEQWDEIKAKIKEGKYISQEENE